MKPCATIDAVAQNLTISNWNDLCVDDKKVVGFNMGDAIPQVDIPRLLEFYQLGKFSFDISF